MMAGTAPQAPPVPPVPAGARDPEGHDDHGDHGDHDGLLDDRAGAGDAGDAGNAERAGAVEEDGKEDEAPETPAIPAEGEKETPGKAAKPRSRVDSLYERGKESARRRRTGAGRTPEQQGCTFKPRINGSRRGRDAGAKSPPSPASDASRFEALYEQGLASKERLEVSRLLAERASTPSFRPKINRSQAGRPQNAGVANDEAGAARFEKLYANALEQRRALAERQKQLVDAECTFRPRTSAAMRKSSGGGSTGHSPGSASPSSPATRQERLNELYNHAKQVEEKRKKMAERLASEFTFKPRTNASSARELPRRSLDSLYPDPAETAARTARLEAIRQLRELEGCTFTPSLEARGVLPENGLLGGAGSSNGAGGSASATRPHRAPADGTGDGRAPDVHARLYEQARVKTKQRRSVESAQALSAASGKLPSSSASTSAASTISAISPSGRRLSHDSAEKLYARLYQQGKEWAQKKAREEEAAQQRREDREWAANADECTFRPNIPHASRLMASRAQRGTEAEKHDGTIFDRLYAQSVEKRAKQRMGAADRLGHEFACTFQPHINETSKMLAARRHNNNVGEREALIRSRLVAQRAENLGSHRQNLTSASLPEADDLAPLSDAFERMGHARSDGLAAVDLLAEDEGDSASASARSVSSRELMASALAEDARDLRFSAMREESWDTDDLLES